MVVVPQFKEKNKVRVVWWDLAFNLWDLMLTPELIWTPEHLVGVGEIMLKKSYPPMILLQPLPNRMLFLPSDSPV